MSVLICPVCRGEMREMIRESVTIDTCTQCRGVWLDRGELEKLATAIGGMPPAAEPPQGQADGSGFWRQHQARPEQTVPPPLYPAAGREQRRGWDNDDDDDDRRAYRGDHDRQHRSGQKSKLGRLMDFFD